MRTPASPAVAPAAMFVPLMLTMLVPLMPAVTPAPAGAELDIAACRVATAVIWRAPAVVPAIVVTAAVVRVGRIGDTSAERGDQSKRRQRQQDTSPDRPKTCPDHGLRSCDLIASTPHRHASRRFDDPAAAIGCRTAIF